MNISVRISFSREGIGRGCTRGNSLQANVFPQPGFISWREGQKKKLFTSITCVKAPHRGCGRLALSHVQYCSSKLHSAERRDMLGKNTACSTQASLHHDLSLHSGWAKCRSDVGFWPTAPHIQYTTCHIFLCQRAGQRESTMRHWVQSDMVRSITWSSGGQIACSYQNSHLPGHRWTLNRH